MQLQLSEQHTVGFSMVQAAPLGRQAGTTHWPPSQLRPAQQAVPCEALQYAFWGRQAGAPTQVDGSLTCRLLADLKLLLLLLVE